MTNRILGHVALYYLPGREDEARTLFQDFGCTLIDNGPPGFCSALVDEATANHHDNLVYLSQMPAQQWALERELRQWLESNHAAGSYLKQVDEWPEAAPHLGLKYQTLDALEEVLLALERDAAPGGPLDGHVRLSKFRARPGLDVKVDALMERSPAFTGEERPAFGDHIIQCFVRTDMFGLLSSTATIELDYAFEPFFERVPTFGSA